MRSSTSNSLLSDRYVRFKRIRPMKQEPDTDYWHDEKMFKRLKISCFFSYKMVQLDDDRITKKAFNHDYSRSHKNCCSDLEEKLLTLDLDDYYIYQNKIVINIIFWEETDPALFYSILTFTEFRSYNDLIHLYQVEICLWRWTI